MVIGDTALQVDRSRYLTFDLAEEWIRFTGKPFVFAFWAIRRAALANAPADLVAIFQTFSRSWDCEPETIVRSRKTGPQAGPLGKRCAVLPDRKHSLPPGCRLHGRPATLLSVRRRMRRSAGSASTSIRGGRQSLRPPSHVAPGSIAPFGSCFMVMPVGAFLVSKVWTWLRHLGGPGLLLLGLADNSIIPLPGSMDVLTIWFVVHHRQLWFYYAIMATAGVRDRRLRHLSPGAQGRKRSAGAAARSTADGCLSASVSSVGDSGRSSFPRCCRRRFRLFRFCWPRGRCNIRGANFWRRWRWDEACAMESWPTWACFTDATSSVLQQVHEADRLRLGCDVGGGRSPGAGDDICATATRAGIRRTALQKRRTPGRLDSGGLEEACSLL